MLACILHSADMVILLLSNETIVSDLITHVILFQDGWTLVVGGE